ncbi:fungal-specific transcription factor [Phycomyces blakesleeanus]|uniref:Fungal-specific transcription factor n=1 Tax=Phycomyces blakesleeanus TaxID=4837 RepID=A0ABR3ATT3_PHYBL
MKRNHPDNSLQVNFISPPPLGFPSSQLVQSLAKDILNDLSMVEAEIRQNTGASLVIKQFVTPGRKPKGYAINKGRRCDNGLTDDYQQLRPKDVFQLPPSPPQMTQNAIERQTGVDRHGHFMGETSFYETSWETPEEIPYPTLPTSAFVPPQVSLEEQADLVHFTGYDENQSRFADRTEAMITYVSQLIPFYLDCPRTTTLQALLMFSGYLEQTTRYQHHTMAWVWAGSAFRMAQEMGLHRQTPSDVCLESVQRSIRTFWFAFVKDRSMSLTYGRPFMFEEKDINLPLPVCLPDEDLDIQRYVTNFNSLIELSRLRGRIIKFNYLPQSSQGPTKHNQHMLSTLDSCICSMIKDTINHAKESPTKDSTSFERIMLFGLHSLLILLHRPFIEEEPLPKSTQNLSLEICSYAATIITHMALATSQKLSILHQHDGAMYAIITAMQIHLRNASIGSDQKLTAFGEINFEKSVRLFQLLIVHKDSMFVETLAALEQKYRDRENHVVAGYSSRLTCASEPSSPRSICQDSLSCSEGSPRKKHCEDPEEKPTTKPAAPFKIISFNPANQTRVSRQTKDKQRSSQQQKQTNNYSQRQKEVLLQFTAPVVTDNSMVPIGMDPWATPQSQHQENLQLPPSMYSMESFLDFGVSQPWAIPYPNTYQDPNQPFPFVFHSDDRTPDPSQLHGYSWPKQ